MVYIFSLASVIQKEAATTNEMPIVSSVIYNRLKKVWITNGWNFKLW